MPCEAVLASPASLRDANRVCFLTAATRRLIAGDAVRSWSSDATRLARNSDLWLTTEDCAQAASDAAAALTASHRMTLAASLRSIPISKYEAQIREVQARSMDMLQSPTCAPAQAKNQHAYRPNPIGAEPWLDKVRPGLASAIRSGCGDWVTARRAAGCRLLSAEWMSVRSDTRRADNIVLLGSSRAFRFSGDRATDWLRLLRREIQSINHLIKDRFVITARFL